MLIGRRFGRLVVVALCEEGVDRNKADMKVSFDEYVALCEEGVDRNALFGGRLRQGKAVALCEEGVDRNLCDKMTGNGLKCRPLRRGRG